VVLFECLNGARPFVADSPIATALAHIRDEVPPLPDHVPPALAHVVRRALAKDPAERYADGAAFAAALREAGTGAPAGVVPPPDSTQVLPATAAAAPVAAAAAATSQTPQAAEPVQSRVTTTTERNRWPMYAVGVVALLVLAVLLVAHPWTDNTSSDDGGTTPGAETVRVRAAAYIGDPVEDVKAALADKGLKTKTNEIDNSGDHDAGTVADLDPTGRVKKGSTITLDVWAEPSSDNSGDNKGDNQGQDKKTKPPKPGKSDQPEPAPPGQSDDPGNTDPGNSGGASSSAAPGGRENNVKPSKSAEPDQGKKGD
jgi:hypothetical protein